MFEDLELPDLERKYGNLTLTYASQVHVALVEVDPETGEVGVFLRVTVVEDYPDVDPELTAEEVAAVDEGFMLLDEAREYNEEAAAGDIELHPDQDH